jgi:hypothetical protein
MFHIYHDAEVGDNVIIINLRNHWELEGTLCDGFSPERMKELQPTIRRLEFKCIANSIYVCPKCDDIKKIREKMLEYGFYEDQAFIKYIDATRNDSQEEIDEAHNERTKEQRAREEFLKGFEMPKSEIIKKMTTPHGDFPVCVIFDDIHWPVISVGIEKIPTEHGEQEIIVLSTSLKSVGEGHDPDKTAWLERSVLERWYNHFGPQATFKFDNDYKAYVRMKAKGEQKPSVILVDQDGVVVESVMDYEGDGFPDLSGSIGKAFASGRAREESPMQEPECEEWMKAFKTNGVVGEKVDDQKLSADDKINWHDGWLHKGENDEWRVEPYPEGFCPVHGKVEKPDPSTPEKLNSKVLCCIAREFDTTYMYCTPEDVFESSRTLANWTPEEVLLFLKKSGYGCGEVKPGLIEFYDRIKLQRLIADIMRRGGLFADRSQEFENYVEENHLPDGWILPMNELLKEKE